MRSSGSAGAGKSQKSSFIFLTTSCQPFSRGRTRAGSLSSRCEGVLLCVTEKEDEVGLRLYRAAVAGDLVAMAAALARDSEVNGCIAEEGGRTALIGAAVGVNYCLLDSSRSADDASVVMVVNFTYQEEMKAVGVFPACRGRCWLVSFCCRTVRTSTTATCEGRERCTPLPPLDTRGNDTHDAVTCSV